MRKLLLLITALLTLGVSGAWAETRTFTVSYAKGNEYGIYYKTDGTASSGLTWDIKWVSGGNSSSQFPNVTIACDQASISSYNGYFLNGNYTISVPKGLVITGYTMQAKAYEEGATGTEKYITPAGADAVTLNTSFDEEIAVTGLSSNSTTFTITGTNGTSSRVIFSSFTITVQATAITAFSELSNDKAYYIVAKRGYLSTTPGVIGNMVKNTSYLATPLQIVQENESYYLKTTDGFYANQTGVLSSGASDVLSSDASGNADFPFVLKIGANYLNSGTGGVYGVVWNDYGSSSSQYDAGNCYAILEVPLDELSYSLSDSNGATYNGSYQGIAGVTIPMFVGCDGYSLTNVSWNDNTMSATVNFPFSISSNNVSSWVYIGNFGSSNFNWFVDNAEATKVYVNGDSYTITNDNYTQYQWAIEPSITGSSITFKIKNGLTGKYITSASTTNSHSNVVSLTAEGTALTYILDASYNRWCLPTTTNTGAKLELSINSSSQNKGRQELGTYTVHNGTIIKIVDADDFAELISTLQSLCNEASAYPIAENTLNRYWGETASDIINAIATSSSQTTFTADELNTLISTLEDPASKLSINQPSGMLVRLYSPTQKKYMGVAATGKHPLQTSRSDAGIYYVTSDNHIVSYKYGQYLSDAAGAPHALIGNTGGAFTFSTSDVIGNYYIYCGGYLVAWDSNGSYYTDRLKDPNGYARWTIEAVESLPVSIGTAGYASLYSPVALTIPEGVTAYVATEKDKTTLLLTAIDDNIIPANVGVVLKGEAGTYEFAVTSDAGTASSVLSGRVATIAKPETAYYLSNGASGIGFYKVGATTLAGFKAYYESNDANPVKIFQFGTTDGIVSLDSRENLGTAPIYTLAGQRVQKVQRGIYVIGGKKVVVK